MPYEVLARKWRPQIFEEVIGQEHITQTLVNAINTERLAHAYLFSGARGVGKTSVARILAKAINCLGRQEGNPCNKCSSCTEITAGSSVDIQEIDGASNRGIDEIRELRENIKYMPSSGKYRVYIIDEVHMLTLPAFNALLKTLEEPPPHVKFLFATTEPHKVPITILSRCQRFDFKRIPLNSIVQHLKMITESEEIEISESGLTIIAREAEGSMRDAESLLDQVASFTGAKVDDKDITDILGIIDRDILFETSRSIIDGSPENCIKIVERIYNYGYDIKEFYRALMDQIRNLLVSIVAPKNELLDMTVEDREEIKRQAETAGLEKLQQSLNILITRENDLRYSSNPRLLLEAILIKLCRIGDLLSFEELIKKIESLEKRIALSPSLNSTPFPEDVTEMKRTGKQAMDQREIPGIGKDVSENLDWKGFLDFLASKSRPMFNVLKEWSLDRIEENNLIIIRGGNHFTSTYLDDPENFNKFILYCKDYFKRDLNVNIIGEIVNNNNTKPEIKKKENNAEVKSKYADLPQPVQEVLQVFQGEIKES